MKWENFKCSSFYLCYQCSDKEGNKAEVQVHRHQYVFEVVVEYSTMLKYTICKEYAPNNISAQFDSMLEPFRNKGVDFPKFDINI